VSSAEQYVSAGPVESLPVGAKRTVYADDVTIVLVNLGGELFALDDRCPHQGGPLSRGTLQDDALMCPWHCWTFEVRTGRPRWPESGWRATRYPVKVEDGQILVRIG
jgi:nitrite reductase/ring-hydroxylating ferredoxin subunit